MPVLLHNKLPQISSMKQNKLTSQFPWEKGLGTSQLNPLIRESLTRLKSRYWPGKWSHYRQWDSAPWFLEEFGYLVVWLRFSVPNGHPLFIATWTPSQQDGVFFKGKLIHFVSQLQTFFKELPQIGSGPPRTISLLMNLSQLHKNLKYICKSIISLMLSVYYNSLWDWQPMILIGFVYIPGEVIIQPSPWSRVILGVI